MAIIEVKEIGKKFYKCNVCGHSWLERKAARKFKDELPALCPSCNSPYWNREEKKK